MSYELVKSINLKKHTFTSASNNVRPLDYHSNNGFYNVETDEDFIKQLLIGFYYGDLVSRNDELCFRFIWAIKNTNQDKLNEANYDQEKIANLLYETYKKFEDEKGQYVLRYVTSSHSWLYFKKLHYGMLDLVDTQEKAKKYKSLRYAESIMNMLNQRLNGFKIELQKVE